MKSPVKKIIALAIAALLAAPALSLADDVDTVLDGLQKKYDGVVSLSADFTQETYYKVLNQRSAAGGKVYFKKPGKMRWKFSTPDTDEVISNGVKLWIYQKELGQVIETSLSGGPPAIALGFLTGIGDIKKDFKAALLKSTGSTHLLSLTPVATGQNFEKLVVEADAEFFIVKTTVVDIYGGETAVTFKNVAMNPDIKDSFFEFKAPKGVKIVRP